MLKKGKIDLEIPLLKFQFPFLNFFYYTYYQITFSIIFFKVTPKGAKLCKVALGMLNDRGNSTTSPCLVWLIVKLICYTQTLRVFHFSYFKYVLQISFNSFQFISSKFWKSVIFNLFEVSFLISNEINFLNKFFSEIFMITSIITYSRTTDYLFFILSGKWVHDFWYQLFFLYFEW